MKYNFEARLAGVRAALLKQKLFGLVAVTIEDNSKNVRYLSGFGGTTAALLVTQKDAVLVVDGRYILRAQAEAQAAGVRVVLLNQGHKIARAFASYVLTALEAAHVPQAAKIGFEDERVSHGMVAAWSAQLSQSLISTSRVVDALRQVKDAEEIRQIARAGRVTSSVFAAVSRRIRVGQTEKEVARMLDHELRISGAQKNSFDTIVASGPNSAIPHHEAGSRKLKAGDSVVLDFGGVFAGGYCSDLTRTIFVPGRKPHAELVKIYRIVHEANKKAFRALKPGLTWKEYDAVARSYIEERGYGNQFSHGLGHSLGLEAHDPYDYSGTPFSEGVVLSNEPGIYIPHLGGVRIEDDVVVTETGARRLTPAAYLSL